MLVLFVSNSQALTSQQTNYKKVVSAFVKGDTKTVKKLAPKLKNYILYPYVEYFLAHNFSLKNKKNIDKYLKKHQGKAIANRLKSKWINYLIKHKYYTTASKYTAQKHAISTRCKILTAKIKLGKKVEFSKDKDLWLYGSSRPDVCNAVFSYWKRNKSIGVYNYSLRTKLAIAKNDLKFANRLAKKSDQRTKNLMELANKRRKAIVRAKDFPKNGYQLLNSLPSKIVNDDVRSWKARQYIYHANWRKLLNEINKMPKRQRDQDVWQYWTARSQAKLGNKKTANKIYRKLAKSPNYYGFLSADWLSLPYSICNKTAKVNEKKFLKKHPNIAIALELYKLDTVGFASSEWNNSLRTMNKADKVKAGALASKYGWHNKAIYTLGTIGEFTYYKLRFPIKWQDTVNKHSKKHALSPAYVYGVMRTESLMQTDAKSRVGAIGLMQLMPKTAKLVSRKHKLPKYQTKHLYKPKNNIAFGTAYLKDMNKKWDDQFILTTASYNAGPKQVKIWLKNLPKEADRFIDTIPYNETRKYVTRVLDYTTMYNWVLYGSVLRAGNRISNIDSNKPFIKSKNKYTMVLCRK